MRSFPTPGETLASKTDPSFEDWRRVRDAFVEDERAFESREAWLRALRKEILTWMIEHDRVDPQKVGGALNDHLRAHPNPYAELRDLAFAVRLLSRSGSVNQD